MATRPRRELISVKLPKDFNPAIHERALLKLIVETHGAGFEIENINPALGTATASRMVEINEVAEVSQDSDTIEVRLTRSTKPGDGDKFAAKLESQHDGFYLTEFEPFLGYAMMTRLTPEAARARGAIAVALGTKPWDVQIKSRPDGGYSLKLPRSFVVSKHEAKLDEVAVTVIGREGWYVKVDAAKLTAEIIPADPPTFPSVIPYPMKQIRTINTTSRLLLAQSLGKNADEPGEPVFIDFDSSPHTQLNGTTNSGKSVTINSLIAGALAAGYLIGVINVPHKAVDFNWVRPWVAPGFWGVDSLAASATVASLVYEEGQRRAKLLAQHGATKIAELPRALQPPPIFLVMDELSGLFQPDDVPKGVPKDHPLVIRANEENAKRAVLIGTTLRLAAEMRFVGIRLLLSTQVANATTGIPPKLRSLLSNKLLQGTNPTDATRRQVFNDASAVPLVPGNIRNDKAAAKGVGVLEMEGAEPAIYKGFYASTNDYRQVFEALNLPTTLDPSPSAADIARITQAMDDGDEPASRMRDEVGGFGRQESYVERADGLKGAAAAGHDLKVAEAAARRAQATVA